MEASYSFQIWGGQWGNGVLELLEGHMDVVCGRTLGRGLRVSLVMCCMRRVRVFVSDFGMILGTALLP